MLTFAFFISLIAFILLAFDDTIFLISRELFEIHPMKKALYILRKEHKMNKDIGCH